jgi:putative zinc finger protein
MSETTTNTSGACELVLDYVYGELDDERKRAFEEHLPTCAKCQQEVASFGRVRTAAKRVMPAVEPTAPLGGALHAQLMHAAAQRKPRRGVLLSFPRKIVEHPALSAAAMFVLVGGAIAINWSRGKMAMPAAEQVEQAESKQAEAPALDTAKPTEAAPVLPEPKAKEELAANELAKTGDVEGAAGDKTQLALETPKGKYAVSRPTAHRAAATAEPKKVAPARMKNVAVDGKMAKYDDAIAAGKDLDNGLGSINNGPGVAGGVVGGGGGRFGAKGSAAKSSAPADESERTIVAEKAPAREEQKPAATRSTHGYSTGSTTSAPAAMPPPAAPMPQAASTPATERDYYRAKAEAPQAQAVAKPAANARNFEVTRKQADEWAKSGRCDEAIKAYEELEKSKQYISPTERASWSRCLTQRGRQEEAQQRLDDLKNNSNDSRRKVEASKKSKKAPAADRAPATAVEVQQRAEPAPAQATPPDSTNTKVKPSSSY